MRASWAERRTEEVPMMEFGGREERVVCGGRRGERIRASRGSSRRRMAEMVHVGGSCVGISVWIWD